MFECSGKLGSLINLDVIFSNTVRLSLSLVKGFLSCCHFISVRLFIGDDVLSLFYSRNFPLEKKQQKHTLKLTLNIILTLHTLLGYN